MRDGETAEKSSRSHLGFPFRGLWEVVSVFAEERSLCWRGPEVGAAPEVARPGPNRRCRRTRGEGAESCFHVSARGIFTSGT